MLNKDNFISTTFLQQNVSKTIDKVENEDVIVIRNNRLEAAIISIEKYNKLLEVIEWEKTCSILDSYPFENIDEAEEKEISEKISTMKREKLYSKEEIECVAEESVEYD
ncbi:MAG: type II toxin-antitoxin system Phd/YefM family antitoxin [Clostridiales bacterium]|nr:type II toxin-antitoxin system Phd/YefM family antitoxin [Clostridiales bacterium]